MGSLGKWLVFFGVGSIILNLLSMEFIILMWIDMWGVQTGWLIRIGMIVLGAVLWIASAVTAPRVEPVVEEEAVS